MADTDVAQSISPQWVDSFIDVRREMDLWIAASIEFQSHVPFLGGHDEGAFIASWLCHYQLTKDPAIIAFARSLRDRFAEWAQTHLTHGFYPDGEVHHQTEIFNSFLLRLWRVAPDDRTADLILDAAEHIGNWVPGMREWYDWEEDRFLSYHVGTEQAEHAESAGVEVPDHFRLIQLALGAFLISDDLKYLDLCIRWTRRWATAILDSPEALPRAILSGPAEDDALIAEAGGGSHAGPGKTGRVEPYIAAGAMDVLLDLYKLVGDPLYANAARILTATLVEELPDPYANPAGALVHRYRLDVGDVTFDAKARSALVAIPAAPPGVPIMILEEPASAPIPGIGKRADMIRWAYRDEDGAILPEESPAPSALMLGYQITGIGLLAARAMETAAGRLRLARQALRDGRQHGCAARSVAAVVSGHGRDAGYGSVTGCFYALAHGAIKFVGQECPAVELTEPDAPLPVDAAALTRCGPGDPPVTTIWRDGKLASLETPE